MCEMCVSYTQLMRVDSTASSAFCSDVNFVQVLLVSSLDTLHLTDGNLNDS